jgi:acetyltransferase-like isoleucine patch superfamily enzyme
MLKLNRYWKVFKHIYNRGAEGLDETLKMYENAEKGKFLLYGNNTVSNSTIGRNSYVAQNTLIYNTDIGNYCSIGPNVVIGFGDHPTDKLTTSPTIYYNEAIYTAAIVNAAKAKYNKRVSIGHDVWIGGNVLIKNGITIGNGAIIGANSLVTKDVPDYAIVFGSPATFKKFRFNEEIIAKISASKWWQYDPEEIADKKETKEIADLLKIGQ